jgi:hypothetical protein
LAAIDGGGGITCPRAKDASYIFQIQSPVNRDPRKNQSTVASLNLRNQLPDHVHCCTPFIYYKGSIGFASFLGSGDTV